MKQRTNSLIVRSSEQPRALGGVRRLFALIPGFLLLLGFWGMVGQELDLGLQSLAMVLPALCALTAGLLLRWDSKLQVVIVLGALVLAGAACAVLSGSLSAGIAALMEGVGDWWFMRTGTYVPGYVLAGDSSAVLVLLALTSGFVTAFVLRANAPIIQVLLAALVLVLWASGLVQAGWWLFIYLLGVLTALAHYSSGCGKSLAFAGASALVLSALIAGTVALSGVEFSETAAGNHLAAIVHDLKWEDADNPLPEGELEDLGAFAPSDDAALEVSMQSWTALYLRGYVAGDYTEHGWEPLGTDLLYAEKDVLYGVQEEVFCASTQLASAWQSLGVENSNAMTVRVLGACRSTAYLPYGASGVSEGVLSSADLLQEGMGRPETTSYGTQMHPVETAYLLQAELEGEASSYRQAESAYRDWVYEHYLTVPEGAYQVLAKHFSVEGGITTVQAKREITELMPSLLEYDEGVFTSAGERGFLSYVLDVSKSGYSVHYATISTLLLRCCGIPARYVEGYVVSPSQAEALTDGASLTLTQRNAHAWTEYYLDGVGWVPFDATPGYTDFLTFELPDEGTPTQESGGAVSRPKNDDQEEQDTKPKVEEKTKESQRVYVRQAVSALLFLLVAALVLALLRTVWLRRHLRNRLHAFLSSDLRKACCAILCYAQVLTEGMGRTDGSLPASELAGRMAAAVGREGEAAQLETLLNEVWYSAHDITDEQREAALSWLESAEAAWKKEVPAAKRFRQRFVACKVL